MKTGWLAEKLKERGRGSQSRLAEFLRLEPSAISRMIRGERAISAQELLQIAEFFGQEVPELVRVEVDQNGSEVPRGVVARDSRHGIPKGEIPQIDAGLGAGLRSAAPEVVISLGDEDDPQLSVGAPVLDTWKIPPTVLARRIRSDPKNLHFIECEGDSMEPAIKDGDVVMIDQTRTNPRMPGIFALWEGDGLTLKRVELVHGDVPRLRLIPANAAYSAYEVLEDDVQIIGRYVARFTVD